MLSAAKGILLDWDGCIAVGNRVLPTARKLIARHAGRVAIVSNNSTHLPCDLEGILAQQGVWVPRERIFLAGTEAIRFAAASGYGRIMLFSSERMEDFARELGLDLVHDDPELVLLMRDVDFNYGKLELAINTLRSGAELMVANADMTHPGPMDRLVPETGALLAAVLAGCGDLDLSPRMIGKPDPLLFLNACRQLGVGPHEAVMIGDNPDTDALGARNAGIRSILVGNKSPLSLEDLVETA